ncbi:MAG: winged helix-turn-helix transcriptional regulator [Deltaproteobacteria bacterium]
MLLAAAFSKLIQNLNHYGPTMIQAANREITKAINQFNIVNTIRKAGLISRVEISQLTGQSRAAVTNITASLIKEGMILEKHTEPSSSRGRRRVMLALNPSAAYVVGIKLSAFQLSFAVTNMQADIISSLTVPVRVGKRPAEFITDLMEEGIRHCVAKAKLGIEKLSGIGVGIPGFVDSRTGVTYWSPLYKGSDASLRDLIQGRFKMTDLPGGAWDRRRVRPPRDPAGWRTLPMRQARMYRSLCGRLQSSRSGNQSC